LVRHASSSSCTAAAHQRVDGAMRDHIQRGTCGRQRAAWVAHTGGCLRPYVRADRYRYQTGAAAFGGRPCLLRCERNRLCGCPACCAGGWVRCDIECAARCLVWQGEASLGADVGDAPSPGVARRLDCGGVAVESRLGLAQKLRIAFLIHAHRLAYLPSPGADVAG
jgi:hypothetical protein